MWRLLKFLIIGDWHVCRFTEAKRIKRVVTNSRGDVVDSGWVIEQQCAHCGKIRGYIVDADGVRES